MISTTEVEQLLTIRDPEQLRERLVAYRDDAQPGVSLDAVLRRLGADYRSSADRDALETLIPALLGFDIVGESHSTVYALAMDALELLPDSNTRKEILLDWVEKGGVTPILVQVLRSLGRDHGWYSDPAVPEEHRRISSGDFREVLTAVSAQVVDEASSGRLLDRELFNEYLYLWSFAEGDDGPTEHLRSILEENRGVVELVEAYKSRSSSAYDGWVEEHMRRSNGGLRVQLLEDFGLLDEALAKARGTLDEKPDWLDANQTPLLAAFVLYYENNAEDTVRE